MLARLLPLPIFYAVQILAQDLELVIEPARPLFGMDQKLLEAQEAGKKILQKFALQDSDAPCWKHAWHSIVDTPCDEMDYHARSRAAIRFANCHLELSGRAAMVHVCKESDSVQDCASGLKETGGDRVYDQFFTHVDNICLYAQATKGERMKDKALHDLYSAAVLTGQTLTKFEDDTQSMAQSLLSTMREGQQQLGLQLDDVAEGQERRFEQLASATDHLKETQESMLTSLELQTETLNEGLTNSLQTHEKILTGQSSLQKSVKRQSEQLGEMHQVQLQVVSGLQGALQASKTLTAQQAEGFSNAQNALTGLSEGQRRLDTAIQSAHVSLSHLGALQNDSFNDAALALSKLDQKQEQLLDRLASTSRELELLKQEQLNTLRDHGRVLVEHHEQQHGLLVRTSSDLRKLELAQKAELEKAHRQLVDMHHHQTSLVSGQGRLAHDLELASSSLKLLQSDQEKAFHEARDYLLELAEESRDARERVNGALAEIRGGVTRLAQLDYTLLGEMFNLSSVFYYISAAVCVLMATAPPRVRAARLPILVLLGGGLMTERVFLRWFRGNVLLDEPDKQGFDWMVGSLRRVVACLAVAILAWAAMTFRDWRSIQHESALERHARLEEILIKMDRLERRMVCVTCRRGLCEPAKPQEEEEEEESPRGRAVVRKTKAELEAEDEEDSQATDTELVAERSASDSEESDATSD